MPRERCQRDGKPGWRYGPTGRCYTYTPGNRASEANAIAKAEAQGAAIRRSEKRRGVSRQHK